MYRRRYCLSFHRVSGSLLTTAGRVIFLILDRGPAHIARKTRAFVESLNGPLRLFYLPPIPAIATLRSPLH